MGRHGKTFMNMGAAYWGAGQRDKGLELTQRGVRYMEQAVQQGILDENAVNVGYRNLAVMRRRLGQKTAPRSRSQGQARWAQVGIANCKMQIAERGAR